MTKPDWARHKKYERISGRRRGDARAYRIGICAVDHRGGHLQAARAQEILKTVIAALEQRLGAELAPARESPEEAAAIDADLRAAMESFDQGAEPNDA